MSRIIDAFIFDDELDILELRLRELYDTVYKFILVESDKTFANNDKEYYFEKHQDKFKLYLDKIIQVKISNIPELYSSWERESYQINAIKKGLDLLEIRNEDIIMISNIDEIPNHKVISNLKFENDKIYKLQQQLFYYNIECMGGTWTYAVIITGLFYSTFRPQIEHLRNTKKYALVKKCGWCFSYFGNVEFIQNKIKNASSQEYNQDFYLNPTKITKHIENSTDLLSRNDQKIYNFKKNHFFDIDDLPTNYQLLIPSLSSYVFDKNQSLYILYGDSDNYINVTDKFYQSFRCDNHFILPQNKTFNVHFSDPCPGKTKKLIIITSKKYLKINEHDQNIIEIYPERNANNDYFIIRFKYSKYLTSYQSLSTLNDDIVVYYQHEKNIKYLEQQKHHHYTYDDIGPAKIYGFYHICTMGKWKEIVEDQISTLINFCLYDASEKIYVTIVGNQRDEINLPTKCEIISSTLDASKCERTILNHMYDFAQIVTEKTLFWYIHAKGVTHSYKPTWSFSQDWRKLMEYFLITNYKDCIIKLNEYDTCGVNLHLNPLLHYSGNFFWATSDYVKSLNRFIGPLYLDPEMWICSNNNDKKHYCFFESGVNHYWQSYSDHNYKYS